MACNDNKRFNPGKLLNCSTVAVVVVMVLVAAFSVKSVYARPATTTSKKKVIVLGFDGMDPRLTERLMNEGKLPNLDKLRQRNGYKPLATSNPPQSPVAWSSFINGAGPGSHGIFDFIHRHPERQVSPFLSISETVPGEGYWQTGKHRLPLEFWPFNHKQAVTELRRKGVPFWDYLDQAGINSAFYDLPSNYPPSPSKHKHHSCLAGMGTPDMLGNHGGFYHYSEDGPVRMENEGGRIRAMLFFEDETAHAKLIGPQNDFLKEPQPITIDFDVHRDKEADAAVIKIQKHTIILKPGQWSQWLKLDFELSLPFFLPNKHLSGICRFYLQEVSPNFRLYVTPINIDPSDPAAPITEPPEFIEDISEKLGLFYTTGFQEDHKALTYKIFTDEEFVAQADIVLQERFKLLQYALDNFEDGLLFFYFSSTDVQGHMLWWDSEDEHPLRDSVQAKKYFDHLKSIYQNMDKTVGNILERYDDTATIIVMSDHGFANFKRQFNLNNWLRDNAYIQPADCTSIMKDVDWSQTKAYGLGLNGLYINLKGRERDGIVEPGPEYEQLVNELIEKLKAIRDVDGKAVIRNVYRTDKVYSGDQTYLAPDLLMGYYRDYRSSWAAVLGDMDKQVLADNDSAWAADHCIDPLEVPGILFSNKPVLADKPALIDIAPTILSEYGLQIPTSMTGKSIYIK